MSPYPGQAQLNDGAAHELILEALLFLIVETCEEKDTGSLVDNVTEIFLTNSNGQCLVKS
jgi:hypothetical protein